MVAGQGQRCTGSAGPRADGHYVTDRGRYMKALSYDNNQTQMFSLENA